MSFITAHVVDAVAGVPASGVEVVLETAAGERIDAAATNGDGRVPQFEPEHLNPGSYRVTFATGDYFAGRGQATFYPFVTINFTVATGEKHYHIPLLLSPFAYSTYRGS